MSSVTHNLGSVLQPLLHSIRRITGFSIMLIAGVATDDTHFDSLTYVSNLNPPKPLAYFYQSLLQFAFSS